MIENVRPEDIERRSFQIIGEELAERGLVIPGEYEHIVKRCIHTSADFDYAESLFFSDGVVDKVAAALRSGATIVTDTKMAMSGINKKKLDELGVKVCCYIGDEDVAKEAKERGLTRSYVSMEKASRLEGEVIFAIGNAPTALVSIVELKNQGKLNPSAVIGVPVGFVNVVESKELLIDSGIPCIVNRGRKGGSNIAACIINAIQYTL